MIGAAHSDILPSIATVASLRLAEQQEDEHYSGQGYTVGEGGEWEDSDWGIQAGELAGDWAGSSEDEG